MTIIEQIKAEIERLMDEYKPIVGGVDELTGAHIVLANLLSFLDTLEEEKPMNQEGLEEEIKRYGKEEMPVVLESDLNDIARHFAEWGKEQGYREGFLEGAKIQREEDNQLYETFTTTNDLEEAAKKYAEGIVQREDALMCKQAFIAGAEWQKNKDDKELSEKIASAYQLGLADKEKQMLKDYSWLVSPCANIEPKVEIIHTTDTAPVDGKELLYVADKSYKIGWRDCKEQMLKEAVEGRIGLVGFHNAVYVKEPKWTNIIDRFKEGDKVCIFVLKKEDEK